VTLIHSSFALPPSFADRARLGGFGLPYRGGPSHLQSINMNNCLFALGVNNAKVQFAHLLSDFEWSSPRICPFFEQVRPTGRIVQIHDVPHYYDSLFRCLIIVAFISGVRLLDPLSYCPIGQPQCRFQILQPASFVQSSGSRRQSCSQSVGVWHLHLSAMK